MKILIVENEESDFLDYIKALKEAFKEPVEISPAVKNEEKHFGNWSFLIQKARESEFQSILDAYPNMDLYIIDICLIKDNDRKGLELGEFILTKYPGSKVLYISNSDSINTGQEENPTSGDSQRKLDEVDKLGTVRFFLSKSDNAPDFPNVLINKVKEILGLTLTKESDKKTFAYRMNERVKIVMSYVTFWIDKILVIMFYVLILLTGGYGSFHIIADFFDKKEVETDSDILKHAEHIFLYLLPVFIVFGFFIYYKNNLRKELLGAYQQKLPDGSIDEKPSTSTMNLTKILFLASLISYTLIKAIDEIFKAGPIDIPRLSAIGVLLVLIMTYFFMFNKHHESHH